MEEIDPAAATQPQVGLLDTSIFIAQESGRPLDEERLPPDISVSIVTIGELRWGVLMAPDDDTRSLRLETLNSALQLEPALVDQRVAGAWALLMQRLKASRTRMDVNDSWIAATAMAHGWAVVTQDDGFPEMIAGLTIIKA